jgi:hypothetical protein
MLDYACPYSPVNSYRQIMVYAICSLFSTVSCDHLWFATPMTVFQNVLYTKNMRMPLTDSTKFPSSAQANLGKTTKSSNDRVHFSYPHRLAAGHVLCQRGRGSQCKELLHLQCNHCATKLLQSHLEVIQRRAIPKWNWFFSQFCCRTVVLDYGSFAAL